MQYLATWWMAVSFAAPPEGYVEVRSEAECTLYKGETDESGVAPMLARCHWPEVEFERLESMLGDFKSYDQYIFGIESIELVRVEGERSLLRQVQTVRGLSTRNVLLWMWREDVDNAVRFVWRTASDEPLELPSGHIRPIQNDGHWQITRHRARGVEVEHAIAYNPGGRVPTWLVRQFQSSGLSRVMSEVRALAAAPPPAP